MSCNQILAGTARNAWNERGMSDKNIGDDRRSLDGDKQVKTLNFEF